MSHFEFDSPLFFVSILIVSTFQKICGFLLFVCLKRHVHSVVRIGHFPELATIDDIWQLGVGGEGFIYISFEISGWASLSASRLNQRDSMFA